MFSYIFHHKKKIERNIMQSERLQKDTHLTCRLNFGSLHYSWNVVNVNLSRAQRRFRLSWEHFFLNSRTTWGTATKIRLSKQNCIRNIFFVGITSFWNFWTWVNDSFWNLVRFTDQLIEIIKKLLFSQVASMTRP